MDVSIPVKDELYVGSGSSAVPFVLIFASGTAQYRYSSPSRTSKSVSPPVAFECGVDTARAKGTTGTQSISPTPLPAVESSTNALETPPQVILAFAFPSPYGAELFASASEKTGYARRGEEVLIDGWEKRFSTSGEKYDGVVARRRGVADVGTGIGVIVSIGRMEKNKLVESIAVVVVCVSRLDETALVLVAVTETETAWSSCNPSLTNTLPRANPSPTIPDTPNACKSIVVSFTTPTT